MKLLWTDDGKILVHGTWIKNVVRAYRKDEVDARIKELKGALKEIVKITAETYGGIVNDDGKVNDSVLMRINNNLEDIEDFATEALKEREDG